jgi:hypothetical protein
MGTSNIKKHSAAYSAIESVLIAAQIHGHWLRFPNRFSCKPNINGRIAYAITEMNKAGITWTVQNNALQYVNNIDDQTVWGKLMGRNFETLINEIAA